MVRKIKVTFVIPQRLQKEFKERILQDGYNMKAKSHWVAEALEKLFTLSDFCDLVKINEQMKSFERLESILIQQELKTKLDASIIEIRKKYPDIEGVQSKILRTAIVQRLLRT